MMNGPTACEFSVKLCDFYRDVALVCAADLCMCVSDSMSEIKTLDRVLKGSYCGNQVSLALRVRVQYNCVFLRCSVMEEEMIFYLSCLSEFAVCC